MSAGYKGEGGEYDNGFYNNFFARVGFRKNPYSRCPRCNRAELIAPEEQKSKLCYTCRHWRDVALEAWKIDGDLAISEPAGEDKARI